MENRYLLTSVSPWLSYNELLVKQSEAVGPNSNPLVRFHFEMLAERFIRASPTTLLLTFSIWKSVVAEI